ncbi:MAG: peptidylprolyl isomerase [Planctomycetota bacterium]
MGSVLGTPVAAELDTDTRVLAIVGDQSILYGDIAGRVNEHLSKFKGQVPDEEVDKQRDVYIRQLLPRYVETKMLYLDMLRKVPAGKFPEIEQDIFRQYHENELPKLIKDAGFETPAQLDAYLRGFGSSISKLQRSFLEQALAHEAMRSNVQVHKEVSHDELLTYYREHAEDFAFQARARWERIMISKAQVLDPQEARGTLGKLGNEVLRGAPFDAVAKRGSHGPNANEGGKYDWTTRGSLRSEEIEELIFTIPTGKLSRVIEDEDGFHIIRVIERVDAGMEKFADVQDTIREKIREQRRDEQVQAYVDRLRNETYIWLADGAPDNEVARATFQE